MTQNSGVPQGPWPAQQPGWSGPQPPSPSPQGYPQPVLAPQWRAPLPAQQLGYPPLAPRPKRRNPLLGVLGGVVFVVIAGFFLIALFNYLNAPAPAPTPTTPSAQPTYGTDVKVPAPDPSPPALPEPDSYEQATEWMTKDAVYDQSVPVPTACLLKKVDASTASKSALEKHLNELTACLWTVWNPPMTAAGFVVPRPTVTVYNKPITNACGESETENAFYCGGDQQIYYAQDVYKIVPKELRQQPFMAETILAHEFGHLIQARSGILVAEFMWEQRGDTKKATQLELSRRIETQADCMGGLFLHAVSEASQVTGTDVEHMRTMTYSIGGDVQSGNPNQTDDHGRGKTRLYWWNQGYASSAVAVCNTFVASSGQVK